MTNPGTVYNFLARTHHIRSYKKLGHLEAAAKRHGVSVIHTYGRPGVFYCEGHEEGVSQWAKALKQRNYLGYVLVSSPHPVVRDGDAKSLQNVSPMKNVETMARLAEEMKSLGLLSWFRMRMGFAKNDSGLEDI